MVGRLMNTSTALFALPRELEPDLVRLAYWEGLKRGEADMPFWATSIYRRCQTFQAG